MSLQHRLTRSNSLLYVVTATISLMLSFYSYSSNHIINKDGILYIQSAEAYINGGLSKAMEMFGWPFYSLTIAWLHKATGIDLEISAYSVNALLLVIFSIAALRIYEEINTKNYPLWLAALLILALPIVNDYRIYIIRGHGFLAFMLLALLFFIKYCRQPSNLNALLWQSCAIVATLFRIEGVVFLFIPTFYFLLQKNREYTFFHHFIKLNSILIPIAAAAIVTLLSFVMGSGGISDDLSLRLGYMLPSSMLSALTDAASKITRIMPLLSSSESVLLLASGLITLVFYSLIKNINVAYLAIWFIGHRRNWLQLGNGSKIVLLFGFVSVLPLLALAGNQLFMSSRYTCLSVVLFSLIAYQYVHALFYRLTHNRNYVTTYALVALILIFFLDGILHTGATKENIKDAGKWVTQNIERKHRIACNERRLAYYSDKMCTNVPRLTYRGIKAYDRIINNKKYDYLLVWIDHDDKKKLNYLNTSSSLVLVKEFTNKKKDRAIVYKIQP